MIRAGSMTIAIGASNSTPIDGHLIRWASAVFIHPPLVVSGTITVQVAARRPSTVQAADWRQLESEGTPIEVTGAQVLPIMASGFGSLRVATDTPPAGDEVYEVTVEEGPAI